MDGRNGDTPVTEDPDASAKTNVDGQWFFENWLSAERLSRWRNWSFYPEGPSPSTVFLAVLLLGLGTSGYYWYQNAQAEQHQEQLRLTAQKYGNPLYWPANEILTLDAEFHLATKWLPNRGSNGTINPENGEIKYKLRIEGYPEALQKAWSSEFNSSYFVTIQFLDEDDFRIIALKITLDKMIRTLNPKGEAIGFSVQGSQTMALRTYRQIDDWKITWNL